MIMPSSLQNQLATAAGCRTHACTCTSPLYGCVVMAGIHAGRYTFFSSASIWPSFCCLSASSPRPVKSVLHTVHTPGTQVTTSAQRCSDCTVPTTRLDVKSACPAIYLARARATSTPSPWLTSASGVCQAVVTGCQGCQLAIRCNYVEATSCMMHMPCGVTPRNCC
jgi:hypothetical protein